jgi:hypothetical protein
LIKPNHLVFEIRKNVTSSQTIKIYTQNQSLKWTQRTMGKAILILQRVDFCFQNTRQSKDYIEWRVLGLRPKSWFLKDLFQNWHHSDFISTIRLEYTWHWKYEIWFQNKKIVEQIEFAKSSTEMTSTLLNTPWKVETLWGNTVDLEKENKWYSD